MDPNPQSFVLDHLTRGDVETLDRMISEFKHRVDQDSISSRIAVKSFVSHFLMEVRIALKKLPAEANPFEMTDEELGPYLTVWCAVNYFGIDRWVLAGVDPDTVTEDDDD